VRRDQQQSGGQSIGNELHNPDFIRLAESFGVAARRVSSPAQLRAALEHMLAGDAPALIEVDIERDTETSPWPLIHMPVRPSSIEPR
jgi:acetolactate synthase-1/2/3 large subunit